MHERTADRAFDHHLYADAAQWYRKTLDIQGISLADKLRVTGKLRRAYFGSGDYSAAAPFTDWLAQAYSGTVDDRGKAIEAVVNVARQLFVESRTKEASSILAKASDMAAQTGIWEFRAIADLPRIGYYLALDLTRDAQRLSADLPEPHESENPVLRYRYYREKGKLAAALGQSTESYQYFERAIALGEATIPRENVDDYWIHYALAAWQLGNIALAKKCLERSILLCREWYSDPFLAMALSSYARLLITVGQYAPASEYLTKADVYTMSPSTAMLATGVAIPLAIRLKDDDLLERFNRPHLLSQAFEDGNPTNLGSVVAGFAQLFVLQGKNRKARSLLHRMLAYIQGFHENWDALLAIARYGSMKDVTVVRKVFEKRLELPSDEVARATQELFDAYVAQRQKRPDDMREHAMRAVCRFEALEWYGYANLARELSGVKSDVSEVREYPRQAFNEAALTSREREVVELVLRGYSNRAVASELAITENTVEKHMTAIIGRLGIRSRHQLAEVLRTTEPVMRT